MLLVYTVNPFTPDPYQAKRPLYRKLCDWKEQLNRCCLSLPFSFIPDPYQVIRPLYRLPCDCIEQFKRCLSLPLTLSTLTYICLGSAESSVLLYWFVGCLTLIKQRDPNTERPVTYGTAEEMLLVYAVNPFTPDLIKQRGPHTDSSATERNSWTDAACLCRSLSSPDPYQANRPLYRELCDWKEQLNRCCLSFQLTLSPLTFISLGSAESS